MNEKVVMVSNDYDRIDGRNAYQSDIKCLTLGTPMREENKINIHVYNTWFFLFGHSPYHISSIQVCI